MNLLSSIATAHKLVGNERIQKLPLWISKENISGRDESSLDAKKEKALVDNFQTVIAWKSDAPAV